MVKSGEIEDFSSQQQVKRARWRILWKVKPVGRTGIADLPLPNGHCPPWLFDRMRQLAGAVVEAIGAEFGSQELLQRLTEPCL